MSKVIEFTINNTQLIVNPIGYPRENPHVQRWNKCVDFVKEKEKKEKEE